jgi:hypothetical protein
MTYQHYALIDAAAMQETFSDAARLIQDAIGQTDGGIAGMFTNLVETWGDLSIEEKRQGLADYVKTEKAFSDLTESEFVARLVKRI